MGNFLQPIQGFPFVEPNGNLTAHGFIVLDNNFRLLNDPANIVGPSGNNTFTGINTFTGFLNRAGDVVFARTTLPYTLGAVLTAQKLFGTEISPTGAITLQPGTYRFMMSYQVTGMPSSTTTNTQPSLEAGTATLAGLQIHTDGFRGSTVSGSAGSSSFQFSSLISATAPIAASASDTVVTIEVTGWFSVVTAGTVIPSLTLSASGGTPTVPAGAIFYAERISDTSAITKGTWT